MAEILRLDFNHLPRPTRERLVAITQGQAGPTPIFQRRSSGSNLGSWFLLLFVLAPGLIGLLALRFGEPYYAAQAPGFALAYVLLTFLCLLTLLGIISSSLRKRALPFTAGSYVFPLDTVIAGESGVKVLSAREIAKLEPVHHSTNRSYTHTRITLSYSDGSRESFSISSKAQAEAALARLRAEGGYAAQAMARRDASALYPLDPLFEARMAGFQATQDPSGPLTKPIPSWTRKSALIAFGAACVLGPLGYLVRNLASDEIAFNEAETAYAYDAYLHGGWRHVDEVKSDYLPRAQLKDASAKTDPDERLSAVEEIAKGQLTPAVRAQANLALKAAMHAVFEKDKAQNTVSALRAFQQQHPQAEDVPSAQQRIHELFAKTLSDFKPRASKPDSIPFVEALLGYMEKHDSPPLEVRFRRHNAASLLVADKVLGKADPSEAAAASSHFDAEHAAPREGAVIDAMQRGFGSVFPADVLPLSKGADLDPNDLSVPGISKASIFVDYTAGWSGSTYSDPQNARRFVGIVFVFDVLMTIPDNGKLLNLKFTVQPPEQFSVSYQSLSDPSFGAALRTTGEGPSDSQVYEVMALRAFDQLSSKIQQELFRPEAAQARAAK